MGVDLAKTEWAPFIKTIIRICDDPGIMARARSFALNIVRHNGATNVAQALWNGALKLDHVLAYKAI